MMNGLDLKVKKLSSFISLLAITLLMITSLVIIINLNIFTNLYGLKSNLKDLEKQSLIECLMIQRIKYEVETMSYDESIIYYEDVIIIPTYDFEDVTVRYIYEDYEYTKVYHYDLETKTISID